MLGTSHNISQHTFSAYFATRVRDVPFHFPVDKTAKLMECEVCLLISILLLFTTCFIADRLLYDLQHIILYHPFRVLSF